MKTQAYDLIGDIHGQFDKLISLLLTLGYQPDGEGFKHPEGRQVIFLGDYIDRGPQVREVLITVRAMVRAGDALAIMGNHEYNAICYHTPDGQGDWLRPHRMDRDSGLLVTLEQFAGLEDEWSQWLEWMRGLPMFLDLGGLRAVHACWDAKRIRLLAGKSLTDDAFLQACARRETPMFRALDNILKGPEMDMPEGRFLHDKEGYMRSRVRVRWWNVPERARVGELAMPETFDDAGDAEPYQLRRLPNYGPDEPPVFFGHYWLPAGKEKAPLAPNIGCLDFSAGREGPLVAYRWDGEQKLRPEKYVTATSESALVCDNSKSFVLVQPSNADQAILPEECDEKVPTTIAEMYELLETETDPEKRADLQDEIMCVALSWSVEEMFREDDP